MFPGAGMEMGLLRDWNDPVSQGNKPPSSEREVGSSDVGLHGADFEFVLGAKAVLYQIF